MAMHTGQLEIAPAQVRALLADQFPALAGRTVRRVRSAGTMNTLFRLSGGLAARFALQPVAADEAWAAVRAEADAAAELGGATAVATPRPVGIGAPGHGYPMPWSVQTWVPGTVTTPTAVAASTPFALDLADLVAALRGIPTRGRTFAGRGRGGRLTDSDAWLAHCFDQLAGSRDDVPRLRALWDRLRTTPRSEPDVMSHRDLVPGNVLARRGRLSGVIDVGDLGPADPALDLVGAWHLLDRERRAAFRSRLGVPDAQWQRGRAWAFVQAAGLPWYYARSNPAMAQLGLTSLERTLADE